MEWKEINNDYFISDTGLVMNNRTGRILKPDINSKGYERVAVSGRKWFVHRLVGIAFIPNPDNKPQINHKDMNRRNNNSSNLEWVTNRENNQHSFKTKRTSGRTKISIPDLKDIIEALKDEKYVIKDLANKYNVTTMAIHAIKQGLNTQRLIHG